MIDPKLLAFSLLLGSVSLYLLVKSQRSQKSKKTAQKAEQSTHERLERRTYLLEKAARVEKGYAKLDAQFLEDVAEIKTLAKKYKEQILNAGEEDWKLNPDNDTVRGRKAKRFSDSSSSSSVEHLSGRQRRGTTICDGLLYNVVDAPRKGEQQLVFNFSGIPPTDLDEEDKQLRRKPLIRAVAQVASIVTEHPKALVKLVVHPPASESTAEEESLRVGDLVKDTQYAASVYRQLMPRKVSASIANLLGHAFETSTEERDYVFFLGQLVTGLQPRTIAVSMLSSKNQDESMPLQLDPERCLLPAKQMPLALIGAKVFRDRKHALDTLEIGPFIPISQDTASTYHFAFAEWRIKTLVINFKGMSAMAEEPEPKVPKSLPAILFDPAYGFVRMMAGNQGDGKRQRESGTKIVLVVPHEAHVDTVRKRIELLAQAQTRKHDSDEVSDPAKRLDLFQQKLYYAVGEYSEDCAKAIWPTGTLGM